jgi:hypothetical protein
VKYIFDHIRLGDLIHHQARELAAVLLERMEEGKVLTPSSFINQLENPEHRKLVADIIFSKYHLSREGAEKYGPADPMTLGADALKVLMRDALQEIYDENQRLLTEAARRGEDFKPYLERHPEIEKRLNEFRGIKS